MKVFRYLILMNWLIIGFLFPTSFANSQSIAPNVVTLTVQGPLTPALVGYIDRGLSTAERQNAEIMIIQLDTPGGSIDLMNTIVQNIRSSEIPVAVYAVSYTHLTLPTKRIV